MAMSRLEDGQTDHNRRMEVKWISLVFLLLIQAAHFKKFVVKTEAVVIGLVGESVYLPCRVEPSQPAASVELRWFKTKYDEPVHLFQDGVDRPESQNANFRGRTEVFPGEFSRGNLTLRIDHVGVSDNGGYTCYVQAGKEKAFADSEVSLKVAAMGEQPLIHMEGYSSEGIRLRCQSKAWYPEPQVEWTDEKGRRLDSAKNKSKGYRPGSNGLIDIDSDVIVRDPTDRFICSLTHPLLNQTQSGVLQLADDVFQRVSLLLVFFLLLLIVALVVAGLLIFCCHRQYLTIKELRTRPSVKEYERLQKELAHKRTLLVDERKLMKTAYHRIRVDAVIMTLDSETVCPNLELTEKPLGVRRRDGESHGLSSNHKKFDSLPAALGCELMDSGHHYWEVEVAGAGDWILGVAKDTSQRKGKVELSDERGFWLIQWSNGRCEALTRPPQPISLPGRPEGPLTVGVHLQVDEGRLSFYDARVGSHLYTFQDRFTEGVRPFFGLGPRLGGRLTLVPLTIVPRRLPDMEPETGGPEETSGQPQAKEPLATSDPPATSDLAVTSDCTETTNLI